ncbi:hypothetical protein GF345_02480 [Candidatus Woesearchaeota archaeon]|nr:hypothetical protein [Candidatus Woesearchaeota archaeon]
MKMKTRNDQRTGKDRILGIKPEALVNRALPLIAMFCIYLIVNITLVQALSISHNPTTGVNATDRNAEISWTTDEDADSIVNYGTTTSLGETVSDDELKTDHNAVLELLDPDTTYYYSIESRNESGTAVTDDNLGSYYSFTTSADTNPPSLNATFPQYHNAHWIGLTGVTEPDSILRVYVNKAPVSVGTSDYDYIASSDSTGIFVFPRINLPLDTNVVAVHITDSAGNEYSETNGIEIDDLPPEVSLSVSSPDQSYSYELDYLPQVSPSVNLDIKGNVSEAVNISYQIGNDTNEMSSNGTFEFTVNLDDQESTRVSIDFIDKAGNIVNFYNDIVVDPNPPVFQWTNIEDLDPSYNSHVRIKGNVSKKGVDVLVFVNENTRGLDSWSTSLLSIAENYGGVLTGIYDDDYHVKSKRGGDFEVDIFLTQEIEGGGETIDPERFPPSPQAPEPQPGQQPPVTEGITIPTSWINNIKIIAVDKFGRNATEEGIINYAKCGIGGDWQVNIGEVTPTIVTPELLRRGIAELSFPGELVWRGPETEDPPILEQIRVSQLELNTEERERYAVDPYKIAPSEFGAFFDPQLSNAFYVTIPLNKVNYTQDWEELKKELDIEKDLLIKIPLEIEIPYIYETLDGRKVQRTQKHCVDVVTTLDIEIPEEVIPEWLLKDSIKFIDNVLNFIDSVLEPLEQIIITVFVTCIVSWVVYFVMIAYEKFACAGSGDRPSSQCLSARQKTMKTKISMQWICDRIFCPSVPMIDKYIQQKGLSGGKKSDGGLVCDSQGANDVNYLAKLEGQSTVGEQSLEIIERCDQGSGNPAECCGQRYMNEWDSACVGITNELDEAKCILAMDTGNDQLATSPSCSNDIKGIFRRWKMSDICSSGNQGSNITFVRSTGFSVCKEGDVWYYCDVVEPGIEDQAGLELQQPKTNPSRQEGCEGFIKPYSDGKNVYAVGPAERNNYPKRIRAKVGVDERLIALYVQDVSDLSRTRCVSGGNIAGKRVGVEEITGCGIDSQGIIYKFTGTEVGPIENGEMVKVVNPVPADCNGAGEHSPSPMRNDYLNDNRQFVINPGQDLTTSLVCVCLPGISGNLILWKNILTAVKGCFQSILATGDGSAGVCRDVLSSYVCDVIFKAIRCFKQRFGGYESDYYESGSINKFFNTLSSAGNQVQNDVVDRYGSTNMYNTLFNERKLMTAACLWAFTGTFDLDIAAELSGAGAAAIGSKVAALNPTRRFVSANPLPPNSGKPAWIYHAGVAIIAGTDINYRVQLVCSDATTCNPVEGFNGGQCDCFGTGEKIRDITLNIGAGYLGAGEMIGANDGVAYVRTEGDPVRYDTLRITWEPVGSVEQISGGVVNQPIELVGANPPKECGFDRVAGVYRCTFDVGEAGYAYFIEEPESEEDTYYIGDDVQFEAKVEKRSPGFNPDNPDSVNPNEQVVFYIKYSFIDNGRPIPQHNDKLIEIITDGVYTYDIPQQSLEINENLIMGYYEGGRYSISPVTVPTLTRIENVRLSTTEDAGADVDFYVKFTDKLSADDTPEQAKAKIKACDGTITQEKKFNPEGAAAESAGCSFKSISSVQKTEDEGQFLLTYHGVNLLVDADDTAAGRFFAVDYNLPQVNSEDCNAEFEETWTLRYGLYRCKRIDEDQPYSLSNCRVGTINDEVVKFQGEPQSGEETFQVVCSKSGSRGSGGQCFINRIETSPCTCGDDQITERELRNKFCYYDTFTGEKKEMEYKACTLNEKVTLDNSRATYLEIDDGQGGKRLWCGCDPLDGSMVDCTNRMCTQTDQGSYRCVSAP